MTRLVGVRMRLIFGSLVLAILAASPAQAAPPIDGEWRGSGTIRVTDGGRETVTCRVTYSRQGRGVYGFDAVCANSSLRVLQRGVVSSASAISYVGTATNPEYNISGRIRIVVNGNKQTVSVRADQGSGTISLRKR